MMYGYGAGLGLGGWLMILGAIALIVAVVMVAVWLATRGTPGARAQGSMPSPGPGSPDALELLRMRFARGEITKDEYLASKQVLEAGR